MLLKHWEPINELRRMDAEMGRLRRHLYKPFYTWPRSWSRSWSVNSGVDIDIYQESDNLVVRATLPGINPDDIEVAIADGNLTLNGERKHDKEVKEEDYLHREHRSGSFTRVVRLPEGLNAAKADASYENGVLSVTIPKSEQKKARQLKIKVKSPEAQSS